ncbi:protein TonB [Sporomusa sp. KB1]|nr:protein TonB [Sporomusa sp. KB1]
MSAIVHLVIFAGIGLMYFQDQQQKALPEPLLPIEVELGEYISDDDHADALVQAATASPSGRPEPATDDRLPSEQASNLAQPAPVLDHANAIDEKLTFKGKTTLTGTAAGNDGAATTMTDQLGNGNGNGNGNGASESSLSGGSGRLPYVIDGPPPSYPEEARVRGWEGAVRIRVLILENGMVSDSAIVQSSGYGSIDQSAIKGLRRWRFSPAYQGGRPVPAWVVVPVIFKLQ